MSPFALYIIKRMARLILVLVGLTFITFLIMFLIPSDPVRAILGPRMAQNPALAEALRIRWGLDKPFYERYFTYLWNLLHMDMGISNRTSRPVMEDLSTFFPATIELSIFAFILSVAIGIFLGIISATRRGKLTDHIVRITALLGVSMPAFWIGLMTLAVLYYQLGLIGPGRLSSYLSPPPRVTGMYVLDSIIDGNLLTLVSSLQHIFLPAFILGYQYIGILARLTRSSMLEVMSQDFITALKAKGLPARLIIYKHALKNALIPTTTMVGIVFGGLLSGAVLVEIVFAWPGIGLYTFNALLALDLPAIMGVTLVIGVVYTLLNLLVDLIYRILDPRIKYA